MTFIAKWILNELFATLRRDEATRVQLAAAEVANAQLAAENARLTGQLEWFAQHVNELKVERAALFERVLEIQLPVMQIARVSAEVGPAAATPADQPPRISPEQMRAQFTRVIAPPPPSGIPNAIGEAVRGAYEPDALFEDVGDERAARLGL